jgi:DNA polymerase-1
VSVVELRKGGEHGLLGPDEVRGRYGIEPEQVPDFIALRGDPSDGLPGAPGIGAKTAAELLRAHGTLERLFTAAKAGELKPRQATAIAENELQLADFKRIATLQRTAVKRPTDSPTDLLRGARMADQLGMGRLAGRLEELAKA